MSRLHDRLLAHGPRLPQGVRAAALPDQSVLREMSHIHGILEDGLEHAEVVEVSDVCRYWREYLGGGMLAAGSIPAISPPFHNAFYEFRDPLTEELAAAYGGAVPAAGMLVWGEEVSEDRPRALSHMGLWHHTSLESGELEEVREREVSYPEDTRWLLNIFLYIETEKGRVTGPLSEVEVPVASEGRPYHVSDGALMGRTRCLATGPSPDGAETGGPSAPDGKPLSFAEASCFFGIHLAQPVLLAHAFLHATNITPVEERPPEKLSRRHEKRHGRPLTVYKTLRVAPGYGSAGSAGATETGERRRLHLCRGHFRTYRDKGPGGRTLDEPFSVWIPQHARGGKEQGEVNKEYAVEEPASLGEGGTRKGDAVEDATMRGRADDDGVFGEETS